MTQPHGWSPEDLPMQDCPFQTTLWLEALSLQPGEPYKVSRSKSVALAAFARQWLPRIQA